MFSRLLLRSGSNAYLLAPSTLNRAQPILVQCFHTDPTDTAKTAELIKQWDEAKQKFYGPDRDKVNFPHPVQPETHAPTRFGFLPKGWFDAFYPVTGVSGPYLFLGGLTVFAFSKEIMVYDHAFFDVLAFWSAVYFIVYKWGKPISDYLSSTSEKLDEKNFKKPIARTREAFTNHVEDVDKVIDEEGRHTYMYEVQKENLDLQLEARYRERIAQVHSAVKRRLDYQVEMLNTKKRLEQQHMVDWIVGSVVKGITPQQEKDAINSCITNLKTLAKGQVSTAV